MTEIQEAWDALDKAFGDSTRLLNFKLASLGKLGFLPRPGGKGGTMAIVEWYLQLESVVQSLLDLGNKTMNSDILAAITNISVVRTIANLFPMNLGTDLLVCGGSGSGLLRLKEVLEKIKELREKAQVFQLSQDLGPSSIPKTSTQSTDSGGTRRQGQNLHSGGARGRGRGQLGGTRVGGNSHGNYPGGGNANIDLSLVTYSPPINDPSCRICQYLEKTGDTYQLYDNHHSNYATGCPRFISLSVPERRALCQKVKFCLKCIDPNYRFAYKDMSHKCLIFGKKKS